MRYKFYSPIIVEGHPFSDGDEADESELPVGAIEGLLKGYMKPIQDTQPADVDTPDEPTKKKK